MILTVYVPDDYAQRLEVIAARLERTIQDLAESAITEAVLGYDRHHPISIEAARNG